MTNLLHEARTKNTAVVSFNIYNLEMVQVVTWAAKKAQKAVIFTLGKSYLPHASL